MSQKVLIVLKEYYPKPAPTGVCVQNVQKGLLDIGIRSDILQMGDIEGKIGENEYGCIYSINTIKLRFDTTKRNKLQFYIKKIPLIFKWPVYSYNSIKKYHEWIKKLKSEECYSAIIGVALPVETIIAASNFENFIIYELDSIVNNPEYKRGAKKLYRGRLLAIEKKVYDKASLIIHLENNRRYYSENERYRKYDHITAYTDVPNLVNIQKTSVSRLQMSDETDKYRITYLGSLFPDYRSPEYIITVLKSVIKELDIQCTFYSRGACEDMIEKAEEETHGLIRKGGYIEHSKVNDVIMNSDFLLSIGNRLTGEDYSLPSKVIEYIGSCKPIIHVSGGDNDSAIAYLEKYGLACIIDPKKGMDDNTKALVDFLKTAKSKKQEFQKLRRLFEKNDPTFTARIIQNHVNKLGEHSH